MLPPLIADINITVKVVEYIRYKGVDILSARELEWWHYTDSQILADAFSMKRFVITHDSDFGNLAVFRKEPFIGIIYIRPGNHNIPLVFLSCSIISIIITIFFVSKKQYRDFLAFEPAENK